MKDTETYDVGVIVGRFQIPQLHKGHKKLIDHDASKKSKAGRLALVERDGELTTVRADIPFPETNLLDVVYTNGYATNLQTFDEIRENAR